MVTLYICLDDRKGLLFNKRRQSRDIRVLEDMAASAGELLVGVYSQRLVTDAGIPCRVVTEDAVTEGHYFAESIPSDALLARVGTLVIYRWNRQYPADTRWEAVPEELGFVLQEITEFPGKSHEKITKEVYTR